MRPTPYFRETNTLHNAYVNKFLTRSSFLFFVGLSSLHGNHRLSYEFECYTVQKYDNYASGTSSLLSVSSHCVLEPCPNLPRIYF